MNNALRRSVLIALIIAAALAFSIVTSTAATKAKTIKLKSKTTTVSATMTEGNKLTLKVKDKTKTVKPAKAKFTTSRKTVAVVSKKGVVTAKKAGKATITIKANKKTVKLKVTVKAKPVPKPEGGLVTLPFMGDAPVTTWWNVKDLDYTASNEAPNLNLTVAALLLATNIETTHEGDAQWDQVFRSLTTLGFEQLEHSYFDGDDPGQQINYPAMAFGINKEKVNGKYVVAAVFRGSSSLQDFITDIKSQLDKYIKGDDEEKNIGGFDTVGKNAHAALAAYLKKHGLTKENTTLFITGHSLGAACSSLVGLRSAGTLAEKNSVFCYSFATPNYFKDGMTGYDMKMFSFDNEEDIVPDVPLGLSYYKTLRRINFDREWIEKTDPEQYELFNTLYTYFRKNPYENDKSNFMPKEYSYKFFSDHDVEVNSIMVRNHMPYTYMALILSYLPKETALSYIGY